ncbi:MAG: hypothetical protein JNK79_05845 [Chitinophagaceae bacterium]|nr:hypothetical protein [Chitinophagaceae bacterium]
MKFIKQTLIIVITAMAITSCVKVNVGDELGGNPNPPGENPNESKVLSGTIDENLTLEKDTYTLKGYVYVNNGATLTIAPGTIIKSDISQKGALIVERGSKLIADGTVDQPIVFTSGKPAGERAPGDWGGIILLGKAPTNRPTSPAPIIEGGVNRPYGGTEANDNSGTLRYVRIEFSGIAAEPGSEINGLTLGGVGSGTILENIQVSFGADDAYEFFGGTVNAKNLIAFGTYDDDYDFDFGYNGKIQFAVALRDKPSDTDQANGIECDNDGTGSDASPVTYPQLSNLTLIGPYDTTGSSSNHGFSNRWRRSTHFQLVNSILLGHRKAGFSMESAGTAEDYLNNSLSTFKNNIIAVYTKPVLVDSAGARAIASHPYPDNPMSAEDRAAMIADAIAIVRAKVESEGNSILASRDEVNLTSPFNFNAPNFLPAGGSPALSGASFEGMDSFFTSVDYRGAFGSTDWTAGWTNFDPKGATY